MSQSLFHGPYVFDVPKYRRNVNDDGIIHNQSFSLFPFFIHFGPYSASTDGKVDLQYSTIPMLHFHPSWLNNTFEHYRTADCSV